MAATGALKAAVETIPQQYSHEDIEGRLWDVLWMASLGTRRAKTGCSRIAFEVILHIEGTRRQYQTLILDIGPGDTPEPVMGSAHETENKPRLAFGTVPA